jgi:hypothetical protein
MTKWVCVIKVPECGYVVIGKGTYGVRQVVDVERVDPKEIDDLLQDGFITVFVVLEPDIQAYFPDSESVNRTLRCLIPLLPQKHRAKAKKPNKRVEPAS